MIDVEKIGERENTYEDFLEDILKKDGEKDDCRFASKLTATISDALSSNFSHLSVYDYEYQYSPQGAEAQVSQRNILKIFD